jgi:hypothetical protein
MYKHNSKHFFYKHIQKKFLPRNTLSILKTENNGSVEQVNTIRCQAPY